MVTYPSLSRLVSYTDLEDMPSQHLYQVNYKSIRGLDRVCKGT